MSGARVQETPSRAWVRTGFTLIELLVATALLSIVMSSVYTLTHASLRTWNLAETGTDLYLEARNAVTLFARDYNNIVGRASHLFEGDEKEIVMFVLAQPMDLEEGEGRRLMRVRYFYNRNKNTLEREEALVETALPKRPTSADDIDRSRIKLAREYESVVADNVVDFKITYIWVPLPQDQFPDEPPVKVPPVYSERHRPLWGLPQGVELRMTFRNPDVEDQEYEVKVTLPMRAPTVRMRNEQLEEMFSADD